MTDGRITWRIVLGENILDFPVSVFNGLTSSSNEGLLLHVYGWDSEFFPFPVRNRSARARETISKQRERIAEVDLESIKQAIQLEFYSSFQIMQTNFQRLDATRLAHELAEQSLDAEQKKLNAGTSSTFFILRIQSSLAFAELREISAIANYNRSVADFNRLRGVLE
jgi:outer membrane protein